LITLSVVLFFDRLDVECLVIVTGNLAAIGALIAMEFIPSTWLDRFIFFAIVLFGIIVFIFFLLSVVLEKEKEISKRTITVNAVEALTIIFTMMNNDGVGWWTVAIPAAGIALLGGLWRLLPKMPVGAPHQSSS
jgi:predicted tellurium resistance membrane protein TerC